jgi:hypothetical protein
MRATYGKRRLKFDGWRHELAHRLAYILGWSISRYPAECIASLVE